MKSDEPPLTGLPICVIIYLYLAYSYHDEHSLGSEPSRQIPGIWFTRMGFVLAYGACYNKAHTWVPFVAPHGVYGAFSVFAHKLLARPVFRE